MHCLRTLLTSGVGLTLLGSLLVGGGAPREPRPDRDAVLAAAGDHDRHMFREHTSDTDWQNGWHSGTRTVRGTLLMASPRDRVTVGGRAYDHAAWSSRWLTTPVDFHELVPSWNASVPWGTFVSVRLVARTADGRRTRWKSMGRWTLAQDGSLRRSGGAQEDALSLMSTDTFRAKKGVSFTSYRLAIHLYRRAGLRTAPRVRSLAAVASHLGTSVPPTSQPLSTGTVLPVPGYSQMTHRGEYPQFGGGGEAWCSPTALAMVLAYYGVRPGAREYAWVDDAYADPWVDEVARRVYDYAYRGTGNWPFNTAYAGARLPRAVVTRLPRLRAAERFIARGIPLIVSVAFSRGQLAGAPISSTAGHLVVIVGFRRNGDVVVNDPAAPDNRSVRRVYDRAQFEAAWMRRSHGLTYAIRDGARRFPHGLIGP